jgi:hypothetical protein
MKNKLGIIAGFVSGVLLGFLAIYVLSQLHPEEDLAGIVIITLVSSGLIFAVIGSLIQRRIAKKKI